MVGGIRNDNLIDTYKFIYLGFFCPILGEFFVTSTGLVRNKSPPPNSWNFKEI